MAFLEVRGPIHHGCHAKAIILISNYLPYAFNGLEPEPGAHVCTQIRKLHTFVPHLISRCTPHKHGSTSGPCSSSQKLHPDETAQLERISFGAWQRSATPRQYANKLSVVGHENTSLVGPETAHPTGIPKGGREPSGLDNANFSPTFPASIHMRD